MPTLIIVAALLAALLLLGWLGLRVKPAPYPTAEGMKAPVATIPLPEGLPEPVRRFYRTTYGERIPVYRTLLLSGRGWMAPFGVRLPIRFRFTYEIGKAYRAQFEATWFGRRLFKADETYLGGQAIGHMPTGVDQGEWFDDAMNVRVWCEALSWFPAALLTSPGVCWQAVDDETALLVVPRYIPADEAQGRPRDDQPFSTQVVVVRFDPGSGLVRHFEAMKYRDAAHKILWIDGIWFDQGRRWLYLEIEQRAFDLDVAETLRADFR